MLPLDTLCGFLSQVAPLKLAESWDNVGLLVGDRGTKIGRIMTCLTITPDVVAEAIEHQADLIVVHHPLPFQPLKRITSDTTTGNLLLSLIANRIAVYSAHTAYDSAQEGINQQWCQKLDIQNVKPLVEFQPKEEGNPSSSKNISQEQLGSGRYGHLPEETQLIDLAKRAADSLQAPPARFVGNPVQKVRKIAFTCGSGGSFVGNAVRCGCDAMVTGEATFHTCLEARAQGLGLILLGHYASERFAMEQLATKLGKEFPDLRIWPSKIESDPVSQC